jgi:hypothetical protein
MTEMEALMNIANAALAAAQAANAAVQNSRTPSSLMDRPKMFKSTDRDSDCTRWPDWKFKLQNWLCGKDANFASEIKFVEDNVTNSIEMADMEPNTRQRSIDLYLLLCSLLDDRYLRMVQRNSEKNGYEVYRQLVLELEPTQRGRSLALLTSIISGPIYDGSDFMDFLNRLEKLMDMYEAIPGKTLGDDTKVAALLRHLPSELKAQVALRINDTTTYATLRAFVIAYFVSQRNWDPLKVLPDGAVVSSRDQPTPMDVDAITSKGKGKKSRVYPLPALR